MLWYDKVSIEITFRSHWYGRAKSPKWLQFLLQNGTNQILQTSNLGLGARLSKSMVMTNP